jgi:hypothetical protein
MEEGGQRHAPATFTSEKRDPVPTVQEVGWDPGPVWTGTKNLAPHRGSNPGPSSPYWDAIPVTLSRPPVTAGKV